MIKIIYYGAAHSPPAHLYCEQHVVLTFLFKDDKLHHPFPGL